MLVIGRGSSCEIVLDKPTISRRHATLSIDGDGSYMLVDLNSTNGTFLHERGGWRRISRADVRGRDRVRFGMHEALVSDLLAEAGVAGTEGSGTTVERDPETGQIVVRSK